MPRRHFPFLLSQSLPSLSVLPVSPINELSVASYVSDISTSPLPDPSTTSTILGWPWLVI